MKVCKKPEVCPKCGSKDFKFSDDYIINGAYEDKLVCLSCKARLRRPIIHGKWLERDIRCTYRKGWNE